MNVGNILFEITVNIVEVLIIVNFLVRYFEIKQVNVKYIVLQVAYIVAVVTGITLSGFFSVSSNIIFSVILVFIWLLYSVLFLKGKLWLKLFMSVLIIAVIAGINVLVGITVGIISDSQLDYLMTESSIYRFICVFVTKLLLFLVTRIILKFRMSKIEKFRWTDALTLIVLPVLLITVLFLFTFTAFSKDFLFSNQIMILIASLLISTVIISLYFIINKMNNDYIKEEKYKLVEQQAIYQQNTILQTQLCLDELSSFRHDVKNNLLCINTLILNNKYEEAMEFCQKYCDRIDMKKLPCRTSNEVLNAVLNAKAVVAEANGIKVNYKIFDNLSVFDSLDICSILTNLMDNAIEAQKDVKQVDKTINVVIMNNKNYSVINVENTIYESVLTSNKKLITKKEDKSQHGIGHINVEKIAKKYGGQVIYEEKGNLFSCKIILKLNNFK